MYRYDFKVFFKFKMKNTYATSLIMRTIKTEQEVESIGHHLTIKIKNKKNKKHLYVQIKKVLHLYQQIKK